jgi:hypothetical protein
VTTDWRKLNGVPVLAAREGRRRQRVNDRPVADLVAEYLAKGGKITKCEPKWVTCRFDVIDGSGGPNMGALRRHLRMAAIDDDRRM